MPKLQKSWVQSQHISNTVESEGAADEAMMTEKDKKNPGQKCCKNYHDLSSIVLS